MIEVFKLLYWIIGGINFVIAFFVLFRSKQIIIKWLFFTLQLILNGWLISNYIAFFSGHFDLTLIAGRFAFAFGALIVPAFLLFSLFFPFKSRISLIIKLILIGPPIIVTLMSFGPHFFCDVNIVVDGVSSAVYGDYHYIFSIYILFNVVLAYTILYRKYLKSRSIDRIKLRYIVIGFGIATLIGFIADILFPYLGNEYEGLFGPLGTIFITLAFAYSILRYRLMDIKVVIRKGVVHFLSVAIVLFIYIYLLLFFQKYLSEQYGWSDRTLTVALVLIIVLTIEPLRRLLFKTVNNIFYSKQKSAQEEAQKMSMILSSSMQFDKLIQKVNVRLTNFLETENIYFIWFNQKTGKLENYNNQDPTISFDSIHPIFQYLREHPEVLITEEIPYRIEELENGEKESLLAVEKELKGLKTGMIIPIGEKNELVGAFILGQKKKKAAFTSDNVEYLSKLQFQMTNAIANALLYKQAVERITKE